MSHAGESLLLRADAGFRIGTGHVMRCLALAQAWQDAGGRGAFVSADGPSPLEHRLRTEGFAVASVPAETGSADDAGATVELARSHGARWVVLDGYHFGDDYERTLHAAGLRVLAIDDFGHADHRYADIILNQNLHAAESLYPRRGSDTRLLLGTRYVLLRREFWTWRGWQRAVPEVACKVLVTLGGSDPDNVTGVVLDALGRIGIREREAVVVVGAGNPRYDELAAAAHGMSGIRVVRSVDDMPALMAWAEVAVICAGGTLWELLYLGTSVVSAWRNPVQEVVVRRLGEMGLAVPLAAVDRLTPTPIVDALVRLATDRAARTRCATVNRELIDGRGVERVVAALTGSRAE